MKLDLLHQQYLNLNLSLIVLNKLDIPFRGIVLHYELCTMFTKEPNALGCSYKRLQRGLQPLVQPQRKAQRPKITL